MAAPTPNTGILPKTPMQNAQIENIGRTLSTPSAYGLGFGVAKLGLKTDDKTAHVAGGISAAVVNIGWGVTKALLTWLRK